MREAKRSVFPLCRSETELIPGMLVDCPTSTSAASYGRMARRPHCHFGPLGRISRGRTREADISEEANGDEA